MKNVRPYASRLFAAVLAASAAVPVVAMAENSAAVGGLTFVNKGLVGIGRIPASQRDKFGETFGSGSGMAVDPAAWTKDGNSYKGTLYLLPDRGYNAAGTVDYRPRLNTISIDLTPVAPGATPEAGKEQSGVDAKLVDSTLFVDDKGGDMTGLDPESGVRAAAAGDERQDRARQRSRHPHGRRHHVHQ